MSAKMNGLVWDLALEPLEKLVLLALADQADAAGVLLTSSFPLITAMTGLTPDAFQRLCGQLQARGVLVPLVDADDGTVRGGVVRIEGAADSRRVMEEG